MRIDCVSPIRPLCGIYKSAPRWRKSANDGSKTSCALPHRSRGQVSVGFHGIKSKSWWSSKMIKGVRESTLSVGKSRARNPTQNPTQKPTPNRPEPGRTMQRLRTAPCPQALRSARDAWRAHGPSSEETAHSPRIHGSNKSENQKEKTNSTLNSQPHPRHSTPKG